MKDELSAAQGRIQELQEKKKNLEQKLAHERAVMDDLRAQYTRAAQAHALNAKAEKPGPLQETAGPQWVIIDGLEAAIAECEAELAPLLASVPELSRQKNAQIEAANLQKIKTEMLSHGAEVLRLHEAQEVHLAAYLALDRQLRAANKYAEAGGVFNTLRAQPNYFGDGVWHQFLRLQPWGKYIAANKKRHPESQAASAA